MRISHEIPKTSSILLGVFIFKKALVNYELK
jgi:hypothetical protein